MSDGEMEVAGEGTVSMETVRQMAHDLIIASGYPPDFVPTRVLLVVEAMDAQGRTTLAIVTDKGVPWQQLGLVRAAEEHLLAGLRDVRGGVDE